MSQIVIGGNRREFLDVVRRRYLPFAVTVPLVPEHAEALATLLPWTAAMAQGAASPAAYVCRNFVCLAPATSPDELASQLEDRT
jgi:uncharacterized protein YyaL (SSP411 family)